MGKRLLLLALICFFSFSLVGCATARKQKELEIQGLKNQISVLESQIQSKDEEITSLKDSINKIEEEKASVSQQMQEQAWNKRSLKKQCAKEVKTRPTVKQIQIALKNAGFDPGNIDGKFGNSTREAIKAFQRAHNLTANGRVRSKTWNLLKEYLDKPVK
ncbi:MAG: peptidoglycan-binding protein [Candidatus Omnitrophica bacterium]|nr:peptidoglycan-binding protein [Candidatus Omnitrophota bacterium]